MPVKVEIEYQDQFGYWKHYQTQHNEASAYRTAVTRARSTGHRYRLVRDGSVIDIIDG